MLERYEQQARGEEDPSGSGGGDILLAAVRSPKKNEKTMERPRSYTWTLESKKLRGNDRSVVSRAFELCIDGPENPPITFKMMLCAKMLKQGKGGQSFKMARGQGSVQLKCEHDLGTLSKRVQLKISVGSTMASSG